MDRRSWPWKKKSSDKGEKVAVTVEATTTTTVSQVNKDNYKKTDYVQISVEQYSHLTGLEDKVKSYAQQVKQCQEQVQGYQEQVQEYQEQVKAREERVEELQDHNKHLDENLSVANAEIVAKEILVKQHSKVAEEAVSGWEKAEAEALSLKTLVESVTLSKLTAEDRASHLDGALKECMRQIRNLKEEHEQKLQDVVQSKTRHMDRLRHDFEVKIGKFEQELLRSAAENDALSRSLHERSSMLLKISEEKSNAEAEIEMLKGNVESCEREVNSLKYELHVVSKEFEIRNEEKNMSMRTAEAATKQHMEGVKKIAKLEAECQRLRSLVRKKLPGPAALAQMKQEVEYLGRDYGETRPKRSPVKPSSPRLSSGSDFFVDNVQEFHKEHKFLTERLIAMEEETKMLKEALAKRNCELQASRNLCAKTSSSLHTLEAQLDRKPHIPADFYTSQDACKTPSLSSMSEHINDDAVSCADSWSTALNIDKSNNSECTNQLELMDDFLEMEKLACMPTDTSVNGSITIAGSPNIKKPDDAASDVSVEVISLRDHVPENQQDQPLTRIRSEISKVLDSVSKDTDMEKFLRDIRKALEDVHCTVNPYSVCCVPEKEPCLTAEKEIVVSQDIKAETETAQVISEELAAAISQIHDFVVFLGTEARVVHDISPESKGFEQAIETFSIAFNNVLCSKKSLVDFVFDLAHVIAEAGELKREVLRFKDSEVEIHSPDCIDKAALPENKINTKDSIEENDQNGGVHISNSTSHPEVPDYGNVGASFELNSSCKFTLEEFEELKLEKDKIESDLTRCTENLETTKSQLHGTEQLLAEIKSELDSAQKSNSLAEIQLKCMTESYKMLESRSIELETEVNLLQEKVETLEKKFQDEERSHHDSISRCRELEELLQRNESCSVCSTAADVDLKTKQEKELAAAGEKLAQCQETIFLLGKQLKALHPQPNETPSHQKGETKSSTSETNTDEDLDRVEMETCANNYNFLSDNEADISMTSPISSEHQRHGRLNSTSSSSSSKSPTPEKHTRGISRFFSSKSKIVH